MARRSLEEIMQSKMRKSAKREGMTLDDAMEKYGNPFGVPPDGKVEEGDPAEIDPPQPAETDPDPAPANDDNDPQDDPRRPQDDDDDVRQELARLRNQLAAMQGRVVPEQQKSAALENTLAQERQRYENSLREMQRMLDEANAKIEAQRMKDFSIEDLLSDEEREAVDPTMLEIMKKVTMEAAKRMAPKQDVESLIESSLSKRETQRINDYRNDLLDNPKSPVAQLTMLSQNDRFREWVKDNVDVEYSISAFLGGRTTKEIDRAAAALGKRINDYFDQTRSKNSRIQKTDAVTASLQSAMRREPVNKETQSRQEFDEINRRIRQLSRTSGGRNSEEMKRLLSSLTRFK